MFSTQDEIYVKNAQLIDNLEHQYINENLFESGFTRRKKRQVQNAFSPWTGDQRQSKRSSQTNRNGKSGYNKFLFSIKNTQYVHPMKRPQTLQVTTSKNLHSSESKTHIKPKTGGMTISPHNDSNININPNSIFVSTATDFKSKYRKVHKIRLEIDDQYCNQRTSNEKFSPNSSFQMNEAKKMEKYQKLKQKLKRKLLHNIVLADDNINKTNFNSKHQPPKTSFLIQKNKAFFTTIQPSQKPSKENLRQKVLDRRFRIKVNRIDKQEKSAKKFNHLNVDNLHLFISPKKMKSKPSSMQILVDHTLYIDYPRDKNSKIYSQFQPYKTKEERLQQQNSHSIFRNRFLMQKKKSRHSSYA